MRSTGGLYRWTRTLTEMVWREHISAAMAHSWARAHLVFGPQAVDKIIQLVPLVDRLEWLVDSAVAYRENRAQPAETLPEKL